MKEDWPFALVCLTHTMTIMVTSFQNGRVRYRPPLSPKTQCTTTELRNNNQNPKTPKPQNPMLAFIWGCKSDIGACMHA